MRCLIAGSLKVIQEGLHDPALFRTRLFDLDSDPREQVDLFADRPEVAARLIERMDSILRELESRGFPRRDGRAAVELGDEEREALRRLGYADR
jgi:hypothetical protein